MSAVDNFDDLLNDALPLRATGGSASINFNGGTMSSSVDDLDGLTGGISSSSSSSSSSTSSSFYPTPSSASSAKPPGACWCFEVSSYQKYFDVDTPDVAARLLASVQLWKVTPAGGPDYFLSSVLRSGNGPDAYGPFWLTMSLAFVVSVTSNLSKFLYAGVDAFDADIASLLNALWVMYLYSFGAPILTSLYVRFFSGAAAAAAAAAAGGVPASPPPSSAPPLPFIDLLSLYGYSLSPFLPACLLCTVPEEVVRWLSLLAASAVSATMLCRNLGTTKVGGEGGEEGEEGRTRNGGGRATLLWIAACNLGFALVLKLFFYTHYS